MLSDDEASAILASIKIKAGSDYDVLDVFNQWFDDYDLGEKAIDHIAAVFLAIIHRREG